MSERNAREINREICRLVLIASVYALIAANPLQKNTAVMDINTVFSTTLAASVTREGQFQPSTLISWFPSAMWHQ